MSRMRIAHLVNPVRVGPASDLLRAQPVTFASLVRARDLAAAAGLEVELLAVSFPEDGGMVPRDFRELPPLTRSVLDVGRFATPRKLPLLGDLVDPLARSSDADVLIYTNVDIAVQPDFYRAIALMIGQGRDALIVNRRTIPEAALGGIDAGDAEALRLWAASQAGIAHPGYDCFVFRRELASRFVFADVCIGANYVGKSFALNMCSATPRFEVFTDLSLTFHLGDDRAWQAPHLAEYSEHNLRALHAAMDALGVDEAGIARSAFLGKLLPAKLRPRAPRSRWRDFAP